MLGLQDNLMKNMNRHFPLFLFSCFLLFSLDLAWADTTAGSYLVLPANPGEKCIVCGVPLTEDDVALVVKGRRVPLNRTMVEEFLDNQEKYFARLQPKGALFQEDLSASEGTALGGVTPGWFLFGLYILSALVFGGLSGYAAVGKGLKPIPHFFLGFVFSALGYVYVLARHSQTKDGEVPRGLVKVPLTRSPEPCQKCGHMNHPSARKCAGCGTVLSPEVQSEASRVLG